jgi:hypothetical protein
LTISFSKILQSIGRNVDPAKMPALAGASIHEYRGSTSRALFYIGAVIRAAAVMAAIEGKARRNIVNPV